MGVEIPAVLVGGRDGCEDVEDEQGGGGSWRRERA